MEKDQALRAEDTSAMDANGYPKRRGFGTKVKHHYKRWWWAHLIFIAVCTLCITLPLVFVGAPNIAQHDLNQSTLEMQQQDVSDPTPTSVNMYIVNHAHSYSMYHPQLDSFQAALFLESTEPDIQPFGYIQIPPTHVEKDTYITVNQTMTIADMEQFKAYNVLVMNSKTLRVAIRGRTGLKQSGLPKMTVNYNKVLTINGLNKLDGFNITSVNVKLTPESDGTNLLGTVAIPNPSVLTVDLGNVTMDLSVKGVPIGTSLLPNLVLKPGMNNVPMRSVTNQSAVIGMLTSGQYPDGILPITIVGNSSVNAKGEHLEYYEAAIKSNVMQVNLNAGAALSAIGLNLTSS